MADSAEVVGDELVVAHNQETVRLSLAVPLDGLDVWLEVAPDMPWRDFHNVIRDRVMPQEVREQIAAIESRNAAFAVALVRGWANALNDRLGKALSFSPFGEESEPLSPPTSGNDTESTPTALEPTPAPKRSRRTPSRS